MTPETKIRADQTAYRLLGLVPPDLDVVKTLLDVLEEQAGGFYDPGTKSFYLLDDMPKEATALLAAHEMTHALEDQRYDLDGRIAKLVDDDDCPRSSRGAPPRRQRPTSRTASRRVR